MRASAPGTRFGPDYYGWEPGSPAINLYAYPPNGDDKLGAFAREAILHQPRAYAQAVAMDVERYFIPNYKTYAFGGPGYDTLDIDRARSGSSARSSAGRRPTTTATSTRSTAASAC